MSRILHSHQMGSLVFSDNQLILVGDADTPVIPIGRELDLERKPRDTPKQRLATLLNMAFARRPGDRRQLQRLVFGAQDGFPHLIVDRYAHILRIEIYHAAYRPWVQTIGELVQQHIPAIQGWVEVYRPGKSQKAILTSHQANLPESHVVHENGMRFLVKTKTTDAVGTGIFFDQRIGRAWVKAQSRGRIIMNLFAHAGAFGVAAASGGAQRIDHVDQARKCASWAACNLALNGCNPRRHRFIVDDAFGFLRRQAKKGGTYGGIICDPPTTAFIKKGERFIARDHLSSLAADCCRSLLPGGFLLLSCNHRQLLNADLFRAAQEGAKAAGRMVLKHRKLTFGVDFPLGTKAESYPTKGIWIALN
jgi:23S rRNA (cytosine1962-C5)-methyltransferase